MNKLIQKLNELNTKYYEVRMKLFKGNAKPEHFNQLAEIRKKHEKRLKSKYGDDMTKLESGKVLIFRKG